MLKYSSIRTQPSIRVSGRAAILFGVLAITFYGCEYKREIKTAISSPSIEATSTPVEKTPETKEITDPIPATAKSVLEKKEVPILCYHQIRDFRETDSKSARAYIVPTTNFREQLKMLHDS